MTEIRAPRTNSIDDDYVVVAVAVRDGSVVDQGDALLALESSKAVVDVEAPCAGVVTLSCSLGSVVLVGDVVATVDRTGAP